MSPSIFVWERRDVAAISRAKRREAIQNTFMLCLLIAGLLFAAWMAWQQWQLHERSAETALVLCAHRIAGYPMSTAALSANIDELCSL